MTGPAAGPFDHIETWIFDLDNTLYPAACRLFDQIDQRMGAFIADLFDCDRVEARRIQKDYFRRYGTTMRGLMTEHGIDPEPFLTYVHDIDYSPVPPSPRLDQALSRLPGRKLIFTNASVVHAERVLDRLGIGSHFEATFDIVAAGYAPKPDPGPYDRLIEQHRIEPAQAALVEDIAQNLLPAHERGMTTIWVRQDTDYARVGSDGEHIHHITENLEIWLEQVVAG